MPKEKLIVGAGPIALAIFGHDGPAERRRVYNNSMRAPIFHLGALLCAWPSAIDAFLTKSEARALQALQASNSAGTNSSSAEMQATG